MSSRLPQPLRRVLCLCSCRGDVYTAGYSNSRHKSPFTHPARNCFKLWVVSNPLFHWIGLTRETFKLGVKYYQAVPGDSCSLIATRFGTFTITDFEKWNPAVGLACTQLFSGYYYCVAVPKTPGEGASIPGGAIAVSEGPSPKQAGIVSSYTKYYQSKSGDTCRVIADKFGTFSVAEFEAWNPAVKKDCSLLLLGYYYCIATPGR